MKGKGKTLWILKNGLIIKNWATRDRRQLLTIVFLLNLTLTTISQTRLLRSSGLMYLWLLYSEEVIFSSVNKSQLSSANVSVFSRTYFFNFQFIFWRWVNNNKLRGIDISLLAEPFPKADWIWILTWKHVKPLSKTLWKVRIFRLRNEKYFSCHAISVCVEDRFNFAKFLFSKIV